LERQNTVLKSALQTAHSYTRDVREVSNNFKTFHSQKQPCVKGNCLNIPTLPEIRNFIYFNPEAVPMPDVNACLSFETKCTGKKEESADFSPGYFEQVNDVELDRIAALSESQIYHEDFPNMVEKLDKVDKLKFELQLQQESLQNRKIFRMSKKKIVSDVSKNKYESAPFKSSYLNAHQQRDIEATSCEENYLLSKLDQLTPTERTFVDEASRDDGSCSYERKPVEEEAVASLPSVIQELAGTTCVNRDLLKMEEKTLTKTGFIDPQILALSDSWYIHNKDRAAGTLNSKLLKVGIQRRIINSQEMCQVSNPESVDCRNEYRKTNNRNVNKILGSPLKSMWL